MVGWVRSTTPQSPQEHKLSPEAKPIPPRRRTQGTQSASSVVRSAGPEPGIFVAYLVLASCRGRTLVHPLFFFLIQTRQNADFAGRRLVLKRHSRGLESPESCRGAQNGRVIAAYYALQYKTVGSRLHAKKNPPSEAGGHNCGAQE
jgi:hypothetical protein